MRHHIVGVTGMVAAFALAACGSPPKPEPVIRTVEVRTPVPVSCISRDFPAAPVYPDTREALRAATGTEDRLQLLAAGWFARDARLAFLEGVVANCRRVAPPPDG